MGRDPGNGCWEKGKRKGKKERGICFGLSPVYQKVYVTELTTTSQRMNVMIYWRHGMEIETVVHAHV